MHMKCITIILEMILLIVILCMHVYAQVLDNAAIQWHKGDFAGQRSYPWPWRTPRRGPRAARVGAVFSRGN